MYTSNTGSKRADGTRCNFIRKTSCDSPHAGFTLIELLVVIAIIALLLGIVVPALRLAKEKGGLAVCLYNVRQLSTAWFSYKEENKGVMVLPSVGKGSWVNKPLGPDGDEWKGVVTDEEEIRGIEDGRLYPYANASDAYHCPVDNKRKRMSNDTKIFRTYSIAEAVGSTIKKYHELKTPGIYYNFIEEAECKDYNDGSWMIQTPAITGVTPGVEDQGWRWQDPMAINHGQSGVLGFCDGHAESHKWVDPWTRERITLYYLEGKNTGWGTFENSHFMGPRVRFTDLNYMGKGWADRSCLKR